ncbi:hypothetical protein FXN61_01510 [Lentzea sp. PSKA42]|uniref:Secreted protein n=1 Tax=Lentzea indica TaxID=2604800 RepID=A0ABX1F9J1_9PSEU|nr:hypothetical protein [Lentzea indica]NKE55570.1 hypothetical protein [Lentzea indica]
MLIKLGIVTTGVALLLGGTAQAAEPTPPTCPSAVQIGSTGVVKRGTTTMATITQFEGCGAKYGHIRVQASNPFRASIRLSGGGSFTPPTQGALNQRDVWTSSKALNDKCTAAVGTVQIGEDELTGRSGLSC